MKQADPYCFRNISLAFDMVFNLRDISKSGLTRGRYYFNVENRIESVALKS